jgi:hypothetical protein
MERPGKKPLGGSEVAHGQYQAETVRWTPQRRKKRVEVGRDVEKLLPLRMAKDRRYVEGGVLRWREDLQARHRNSSNSMKQTISFLGYILRENAQAIIV